MRIAVMAKHLINNPATELGHNRGNKYLNDLLIVF